MSGKQGDKKKHTQEETRHDLKNYLDTIIKKSVKVAEGPIHQKPMVQYANRHPVTLAYRELASEFLRRENA